jgi:archaeal chaperonin
MDEKMPSFIIPAMREGGEGLNQRSVARNNIAVAVAVADTVRSSLGPRGMDKMVVSQGGEAVISNDGFTILREMQVEHPVAKMMVDIARTQDEECGDGTTSAVIIAGELLKKAEALLDQNLHPTVITNGFRLARREANKILQEMAEKISPGEPDILKRIAVTAINSKAVAPYKEKIAEAAVKAIRAVAETRGSRYVADINNIKIEAKPGQAVTDLEFLEGIILDRQRLNQRMPRKVEDADIALIDCPLEIKRIDSQARIEIRDPEQLKEFQKEEQLTLKGMVEKLVGIGATVLFCQKGIDDLVEHHLTKAQVLAVKRIPMNEMEMLAKATGGKIVSDLDDLEKASLGRAGVVEERKIGDYYLTFISGCKNSQAVSILLRGGTEQVVEETARSLEDALKVVSLAMDEGMVLPGGGAPEIEVALRLREYAATVGGREQLAVEAFADAVEVIPWTLAENAGLDSLEIVMKLRATPAKGKRNKALGLDIPSGKIKDMSREKILEPLKLKQQALDLATEVASLILRIDDMIVVKRKRATTQQESQD